jgi:hypothetical protein
VQVAQSRGQRAQAQVWFGWVALKILEHPSQPLPKLGMPTNELAKGSLEPAGKDQRIH